ncbi:perforin-1.3 [Trichomycterus rosablanca]|uniref:perforin-1.3 n=1 Tax=Trichomycterus rosablanca TaxID=2290929 RepID=UPI002F35AD9B
MKTETLRQVALWPPVLLLALVSVSSCCRQAASTECGSPPFVPGHNLVGEGFDIVHMKTTGAFVVDMQTYVSGGAHGNCTVCTNSLLGQKEQKIPAAVTDWRVKVNCKRSIQAKVFESSISVVQESTSTTSLGWKVGLGIPLVAGVAVGGTLSKSSKFAQEHSTKDKYFYTSHKFSCSYYSLRVRTNPPLTKEFLGSIQALPQAFNNQSKPAFQHFISVYGTHFLRQVNLGGLVHSTTAVRTCEVSMKGLSVHDIGICLSREASANIEGVEVKGQASFCHQRSKKLERGKNFSGSFMDRVTKVLGGAGGNADLLFSPGKQNGYAAWLKELKTSPGVVSYRLLSLHMLVKNDGVRRAALGQAITDYIVSNRMVQSCSSKCKTGHRSPQCSCKCGGHGKISSDCCPTEPGVAELTVTVLRASGLWGDYFSKTDGYVKVFYDKKSDMTPVIWNNNFPQWNHVVRFGTVDLTKRVSLKLEVWDRDNRWDDDRLGSGTLIPKNEKNKKHQIRLKHGMLFFSINASCAPHLEGEFCQSYSASPESSGRLTYAEELRNPPYTFLQEKNAGARGHGVL